MTSEKTLREAPLGQLLAKLCLPVILVMLVNVLYNMADVFFLGRAGDPLPVAAVSLAGPVFSVFSAFNTLLGFGACTAASMALGRGDRKSVRQYSSFCLYASLLIGAVCTAVTWAFTQPLVTLLGAEGPMAELTGQYLRVYALGAPLAIAAGSMGNTLRADGGGKDAVMAAMSGTLVNLLLDPVMISLLGWGVTGAAVATVLGNGVSFVAIVLAARKKEYCSLSLKDLTLRPQVSLKVLSLGLPMAAGLVLMSFSSAFANRLLIAYGSEAVAAQGVAGKAGMLVGMIVMGICMGVQPAVSYAYGRGDRARLRQVVWGTGLVSAAVGALLGAVFFAARTAFVSAFLPDPTVLELGETMVLATVIAAPLGGVYQICQVYLQGTGKVSYATVTALLQKGLVYVPVLYGMHALLGLPGLIFAPAVTDLISTAVGLLLSLRWSRQQRERSLRPLSSAA